MEKQNHRRRRFWTVPNLMSLFRVALIPWMMYEYAVSGENVRAAVLLGVSAFTDVADGWVARRFQMVSDWGKLLDPLADKLTQGALLAMMATRHPALWWLVVLLAAKETVMLVFGVMVYRASDVVNSAQWFGKVNTVLLTALLAGVFLVPGMPAPLLYGMILLCSVSILASLGLYCRFYMGCMREMRDGRG